MAIGSDSSINCRLHPFRAKALVFKLMGSRLSSSCWTNFLAKALAFKLMGNKLSSSSNYTSMYAPSAERFIGQRLMNVAHPTN